jgi:hypothetical protein
MSEVVENVSIVLKRTTFDEALACVIASVAIQLAR